MVARVKLKTTKDRKKNGRFKPEYNEQVERLCKLGVTDKHVARFFDVTIRTVQNWKHDHPEFFEALHRGKQQADQEVIDALFKNATGFTYMQETIVKKKHSKTTATGTRTWETIERVYVEQHALPQTVAQIFWTTNRQPELWMRNAALRKPEETTEPEKVYASPDAVLAEMKKRGIVMIEDAYTVK